MSSPSRNIGSEPLPDRRGRLLPWVRGQDGEDSHGRREPLSASATSIGSSEWSALCPEHPDQMTSLRRPMHPVPYPSFRNSIRFPRMVIRRTIRGRHPRMYLIYPLRAPNDGKRHVRHTDPRYAAAGYPSPDPDIPAPDPEPGLQPPEPSEPPETMCRRWARLSRPCRVSAEPLPGGTNKGAVCRSADDRFRRSAHATWNARLALSRSSSSSSCNELICLRSPRRRYIPA